MIDSKSGNSFQIDSEFNAAFGWLAAAAVSIASLVGAA